MTKLKIDINFNSSCILTVKDVTGWVGSSNLDGFVMEAGTPSGEGFYKLTDGYFTNVLFYNRYIGDAVNVNTNELLQSFKSGDVSAVYANNFPAKNYKLAKDGVYTFKRLFIISKDYYLANQGDITKIAIYYDPITATYHKVDNGVTTEITLTEVAEQTNSSTTGSVSSYKFISTCYLNRCLYLLQSRILNQGYDACNAEQDLYRKQRDYITMTLNVIKYLKEDGHLTEVQRVIEVSDSCGMVCKEIGNQTNNDCGCG